MYRQLLDIMTWLFFLGGIFGMAMGIWKFSTAGTPAEYGVMGIGGGVYLLFSVITIFLRGQMPKT